MAETRVALLTERIDMTCASSVLVNLPHGSLDELLQPGSRDGVLNGLDKTFVAEFINPPQKAYTFSFVGDSSIPQSVKCTHSATKRLGRENPNVSSGVGTGDGDVAWVCM